MSVLVYSIEAWIMSLVGLCWLACRTIYSNRSFIEEYMLYGQGCAATLNLIVVSLQYDKRDACKSYFIINLVHWIIGAYSSVDSLYSLEFHHTNTTFNTSKCCPNTDVVAWNRQIYFAGLQIFLAPMAITQSLQTIHLIIAAAALSNTQHTLWPGPPLGYSVLSFAAFLMAIKFMGYFTQPCPDTTIQVLDGWFTIDLSSLLLLFVFTFNITGAAESLLLSFKTRVLWYILTIVVIIFYIATIWLNVVPLHIVTWPWMVINAIGVLPCLYSLFDITQPMVVEVQPNIKTRARTKFVMPIQTNIQTPNKSTKSD